MKAYIATKKINREDLAYEAGVGLVTINRLMSGDIPREDTLHKIEANLNVRLTASYEVLASQELGEYPKSWCDDLLGEYTVIRQNRWLGGRDIINTFPVVFKWCNLKLWRWRRIVGWFDWMHVTGYWE
jgi:transcriptional regulator with XRE-family HTH domain